MLSSSSLSNSSPIFYVDNNVSYLVDDSTYFSTSYYHSPSPLIYNNEIDNLYDFNPNHDLALVQQSILAYSNDNNNTSSIDVTDDSSILELDTKVESNKSGDHESEIFNGIVEDNGEMNHIITSSTTTNTNTTTTTSSHHRGTTKKRRTSNKDRHSKIRTAHGLRDRRMRLSLQVARQFFKLQDMLGYDKASATVEWLMMQAKPAINELFQSKHGSPPSGITTAKCTTPSSHPDDCEVESTTIIEDKEGSDSNKKRVLSAPTTKEESKQKRKRTTKEERKVARERAKRRTLEKIQSRTQVNEGANNNNNNTNCFTTLSDDYQHSSNVCQNVPGYRNPAQQNTMEGPQ